MKTKTFWNVLTKVFLLLAVVMMVACNGKKEEDVIKIGAILPLTGNFAQLGTPKKEAFLLAEELFNKNNKHITLKLFFEDSQGTPTGGINAFNKLRNINKIDYFFIDITSVAMSCIPLVDKNKTVAFVGSAHPSITEESEYCFRVFVSGEQETDLIVDNLKTNAINNVFLLHIDDVLGHSYKDRLVNKYKPYGNVVGIESFLGNQTNFKDIITKMATQTFEKIIIIDYGVVLPLLVKQLVEQNYNSSMIIGNLGFLGPRIKDIDNSVLNNIIFTGPNYIIAKDSLAVSFIHLYEEMWGKTPDYTAAYAFDAINVFVKSIIDNIDNPNLLHINLKNVEDYKGVTGNISILNNGDSKTEITWLRYLDGEIKKNQ